jgi:UDP-2,3-diacylglucosamine pyrophosphatase LpxH
MLHLPFYVTIGFGIPFGFIYFALLALLWTAVAGPVQEWLLEVLFDRRHSRSKVGPMDAAPGKAGNEPFAVLVSDIHADTWQDASGAAKHAAFIDFLNRVAGDTRVTDLYINGDICDMPPFPLNQPEVDVLDEEAWQGGAKRYPALSAGLNVGVFPTAIDDVFEKLATLGAGRDRDRPLRVTYSTGNHDIGISGLRYIRPDLPWGSVKVAWNPSLQLKLTPNCWVFIQHGHQHDPFLWIYLRYAVLELLRDGTSVAQRNGNLGMAQPAQAKPQGAAGLAQTGMASHDFQQPAGEPWLRQLVRLRYRQAARRLYRLRCQPAIRFITFGHTHLPDRYRFPGGWEYLNSGDWAGNDAHQCYLKIYASGEVTGPHQWIAGQSQL